MDAEEIWKDVKGYEGLYKVSNFGRVKTLYHGKERILKPYKAYNGYLLVNLWKDGKKKNYRIHRLVYEAFVGIIPKWIPTEKSDTKLEINHKDEKRDNNCLWNLELITQRQNGEYGSRNKKISISMTNNVLTSKKVYQYTLDIKLVKIWPSTNECGRNGFDQGDISSCCLGKKKHVHGYIWSYKPLKNQRRT
jgi:hypothetical protein